MRDHVFLYVNGQPLELRGEDVFAPLSDVVRKKCGLTGTKIVCAEGDCGACSVLIGTPTEAGELTYRTACSCILTAGQVDSSHVITIEGLTPAGGLSPIQASFVKHHGAQCGFCTPGFVVAIQGVIEQEKPCTRSCLKTELAGNLCRCTGYESILNAASAVSGEQLTKLATVYAEDVIMPALVQSQATGFGVSSGAQQFMHPATQHDAVRLRAEHPMAQVLAGGTDLGVAVNKNKLTWSKVINIGGVAEWKRVSTEAGKLYVGALATIGELERAGVEFCPGLAEYLRWFASPLIKNIATVGGNLVTGSPIGDLMPMLLALGAEVELASVSGTRRVGLAEFYTGYRKSVMRADELLAGVLIPLPAGGALVKGYKISRRKDLDITAVSAGFYVERDEGRVTLARIAFGGVAATPLRLREVEVYLTGKVLTAETLESAGVLAASLVTPLTDVRGSAEYRKTLVANLFLKLLEVL